MLEKASTRSPILANLELAASNSSRIDASIGTSFPCTNIFEHLLMTRSGAPFKNTEILSSACFGFFSYGLASLIRTLNFMSELKGI